ncbi:hypothetical protein [Lysinibacillus antri]|uniref:HEAT repeat domain-containing protein n=1 Tax=Lysinibacillus antri TaxID=2498145 RepID=A0A3S0P3W2_9BACI|nr:hypothetical protein [Lysinibacillus antri]RUL52027.1 hypothetical protein EK386_10550 [Lysinibacillus antri]
MTILNRLSSQLDRSDEQPNIELAEELVRNHNLEGVQEIIDNLANKDKKIKHDCIKVAYEIGKLQPELISQNALIFIELLKSKDNRLIWGAIQALSTIALEVPEILIEHLHDIKLAMKIGSVITVDKGVITLAKLASVNNEYNQQIFSYLIDHLKSCRTKEVPQHAESISIAVSADNKDAFLQVVQEREPYFTEPQRTRIKKLIKSLEGATR